MGFDKLFALVNGKPVVAHSVAAFEKTASVAEIILVAHADRLAEFEALKRGKVSKVIAGGARRQDSVAVESPLEIRIDGADPLVAMRTPGADRELIAGLLLSEGVIDHPGQIAVIEPISGCANIVRVALRDVAAGRLELLARSSLSNSARIVPGAIT